MDWGRTGKRKTRGGGNWWGVWGIRWIWGEGRFEYESAAPAEGREDVCVCAGGAEVA